MAKRRAGRWKRILLWISPLVVLPLLGFLLWAFTPLGPAPRAEDALESGEGVVVRRVGYGWDFAPDDVTPETGIVFYPGGRIDPRSYAPLARRLAEEGYLVAVIDAPLNLAVFAPGAAGRVIDGHAELDRWVVGGHSLGGAMAASWAEDAPEAVEGLVLLAAYAPSGADLADSGLSVLSVRGDMDGVLDPADVEEGRARLPEDSRFVVLEGANHSQFGSYGKQVGDRTASMDGVEQRRRTVHEIVDMFGRPAHLDVEAMDEERRRSVLPAGLPPHVPVLEGAVAGVTETGGPGTAGWTFELRAPAIERAVVTWYEEAFDAGEWRDLSDTLTSSGTFVRRYYRDGAGTEVLVEVWRVGEQTRVRMRVGAGAPEAEGSLVVPQSEEPG